MRFVYLSTMTLLFFCCSILLSSALIASARAGDMAHIAAKLKSKDPLLRAAAIEELGNIGPEARAYAPAIAKALPSSASFDVVLTQKALFQILGDCSLILPEFLAQFDSLLKSDRERALDLVHEDAGRIPPSVVPILFKEVDAKEPYGGTIAIKALGHACPPSDGVTVRLLANRDPNHSARVAVFEAIERLAATSDTALRAAADCHEAILPDFCSLTAALVPKYRDRAIALGIAWVVAGPARPDVDQDMRVLKVKADAPIELMAQDESGKDNPYFFTVVAPPGDYGRLVVEQRAHIVFLDPANAEGGRQGPTFEKFSKWIPLKPGEGHTFRPRPSKEFAAFEKNIKAPAGRTPWLNALQFRFKIEPSVGEPRSAQINLMFYREG